MLKVIKQRQVVPAKISNGKTLSLSKGRGTQRIE